VLGVELVERLFVAEHARRRCLADDAADRGGDRREDPAPLGDQRLFACEVRGHPRAQLVARDFPREIDEVDAALR
jgi:hypothetical protein